MLTAKDIIGLARPHLVDLEPYEPIDPVPVIAKTLRLPESEIIKLDGNENAYGPSPAVRDALSRYPYYHIYPDPEQRQLRGALADHLGLGADHIVAGSGADELLDLIGRLFISSGDVVVNAPPTFGMYQLIAGLQGCRVVDVPRRADFAIDLEGILVAIRQGAKLVFLASPNNPTGNSLSLEEMDRLLKSDAVIVVDEAYVEFSGKGFASLVPRHDNLIVLRTFSKWAGLAGLRGGYGVFPRALAELIRKIKMPYNVNVAAEAAMLASLKDVATLRQRVAAIVTERGRLFRQLAALSWIRPWNSEANFLLCRVERIEARKVWSGLRERGILVRHFDRPELEDCLRISIGRPEDSRRLLRALEEIGVTSD